MIDWTLESPLIEQASDDYNVDPAFIKSVREQENGGDGKQFGVISVAAPTYDDQLRICCITVAHRLASYSGNPLTRGPVSRRLVYSNDWIKSFANIWAPVSASPLNESWLPNVIGFYAKWVTSG